MGEGCSIVRNLVGRSLAKVTGDQTLCREKTDDPAWGETSRDVLSCYKGETNQSQFLICPTNPVSLSP